MQVRWIKIDQGRERETNFIGAGGQSCSQGGGIGVDLDMLDYRLPRSDEGLFTALELLTPFTQKQDITR